MEGKRLEILISTLMSVPLGVLSSFLFWWWLRRGSFRYIRLCPDQIAAHERARLMFAPDRPALGPDLVTTLRRTPGAAVRIYLFAFDSFSGARNIFVSPDYTAEHLVTGAFGPGPSLSPIPESLPAD